MKRPWRAAMTQVKWLVTLCLSPAAAVVFSLAICGALVVALTAEVHQRWWQSSTGRS